MPPSLRSSSGRREPNYRPPPVFIGQRRRPPRWNNQQLFDIKILETRVNDGVKQSLVHYVGWSKEYDQWVTDDSIVTRSCLSSSAPHDIFKFQLLTSIRDQLQSWRGVDSLVTIQIPISSPDVAREVLDLSNEVRCWSGSTPGSEYEFLDVHSPDILFGNDWWFRIINETGDFVYINRETVIFRYYERRPREEYTCDFRKKLCHRGFMFKMKFVREKGNRYDLNLLRVTLRH